MNSDEVGAVVIGRNEGDRLIGCLTSLRLKVKCVVYVDSGSTDGSVEAAERFGASVVRLDPDKPFTAARGRNEGFRMLRHLSPEVRLIQFIDGDCELDANWLDEATKFLCRTNDVAVVCGRRRERNPSASVYNHLCDMEWNTSIGECFACGGDSLIRADAFEAIGGFRDNLIAGEEPELCLRLRKKGWKIWRLDVEMTRHDAAMTRFRQWWLRTVRHGYGITELSFIHRNSRFALWKKQLARSIAWSSLLPSIILIGIVVHPAALWALWIYPLQVCRIAIARGPNGRSSWIFSFFITVAKFAEFQGVLKFCWGKLRHASIALIEYK